MSVRTDTTAVTGFDVADAEALEALVEAVNDGYPDTLALLAGWWPGGDDEAGRADVAGRGGVAGRADVAGARIVSVEPDGLGLEVVRADGADLVEVPFARQATDVDEVQAQFLELVERARAAAPQDLPLTSMEQAYEDAARVPRHRCGVVAVTDLTPTIRELTFGPLPDFRSLGGDQAVTLAPVAIDPNHATYTIRRWNPADRTVDIWIVLHGTAGHVSGWASEVEVGQEVSLWGPRGSFAVPDDTTSMLLVCDETALGAVAAILDDRPGDIPVHVVAEVVDADHAVDLPVGEGVVVTWTFRGDAEPGTGTRLLDAVRSLDLEADGLFAFGAAETGCIMPVRRYLRHDLGVSPQQLRVGGYWRRGRSHHDHD